MARDDIGYIEGPPVRIGLQAATFGPAACAASSGPTGLQWIVGVGLCGAIALGLTFSQRWVLIVAHAVFLILFASAVIWRAVATAIAKAPIQIPKLQSQALPPYSVIVPLYHEAAMAPVISAALNALDYPRSRLQILIVLEADDAETLLAFRRTKAAASFQIIVAPPGAPRTKPRACNAALAAATGELVVVYDAEDRPHPLQLKEAAARFARTDTAMACLQAPLRIAGARGFVARQFALEYAAQFEVMLPAFVRLGLPFPLGGTSNHFRAAILKALGGWDAWNVTEDADLGFRLAQHGYRTGLLRTPTWESAPDRLGDWLPQRARWVKGYMQTWGVHMRHPLHGGARRFVALQVSLGLTILSVLAHGPVLLALMVEAVSVLLLKHPGVPPAADLALLVGGWGGAILAISAGARRAGLQMRLLDAVIAPAYWGLQSVAGGFAIVQLCTRPHHWNKTRHQPAFNHRLGAMAVEPALDEKGEESVRRAA